MIRRMLAASMCLASAVLFVLALQAQETRPAQSKAGDQKFDRNTFAEKEKELIAKFKEFEELALTLKQRLKNSSNPDDKARAELLDKVLDRSGDINTRFQAFVHFLTTQKLSTVGEAADAVKQSQQLAKDLKELLDLLRGDSGAKDKRQERLALEKLIKELERVIRDQKIVNTQIETGKMDPKDVAGNQQQVRSDTQGIAKKIGDPKDGDKGGEGKDNKGEAKDGKGKGAKGEGKDGGKGGEAKAGDSKDAGKGGEGKPGEAKDAKGGEGSKGDPKEGGAKGGEGSQGGAKDAKGGEGSQGGAKDAKGGEGSQGGSKDGGEKGDSEKGKVKSKQDGEKTGPKDGDKGGAKSGEQGGEKQAGGSKSGQQGGDKSDSSQSKGGQSSGQQGQSKGGQGGGQGQPKEGGDQGDQGDQGAGKDDNQGGGQQPQDPQANAKKKVQDAADHQGQAKKNIEKGDKKPAQEEGEKAVQKLEEAKKKLEDLLRQLREEELERLLTNLKLRCEKMLAMQIQVYNGTKTVHRAIEGNADKQPTRANQQDALNLSDEEKKIVKEADKAIEMIESEGSAIAFAEVFHQVREDMRHVARRLGATPCDVGKVTQAIEEDIIATLQDMIKALEKAKQDLQNQKPSPSKPGQPPPQQDQKLLDQIAELKMIRAMQMRVNSRTDLYGRQYEGEQAQEPQIRGELRNLADRQERIVEVTTRIAKGDNK